MGFVLTRGRRWRLVGIAEDVRLQGFWRVEAEGLDNWCVWGWWCSIQNLRIGSKT